MKNLRVLIGIFIAALIYGQDSTQVTNPETYVFVHGAWGGAWDYQQMEKLIESKGHKFYRPTLTGQGEREHLNGPNVNLDMHIMDILNVFKFEDLTDVILIGHSYGGMVITGVADKIPEKIRQIVYVDAFLPFDGESVFSLADEAWKNQLFDIANSQGNGFSIPPYWPDYGKDVPHPLATFQQPISLTNPKADKIPGTYILTIEPGAKTDDFSKYAKRAKNKGYDYYELRTGHNPQRTVLKKYVTLLLKIGSED
jgi:pimeloyl-ACP methyl ester carboxylesterase